MSSTWSGSIRLPQQQVRRAGAVPPPPGRRGAARGDDAFDHEAPRVVVVGVEPVALPRVVAEDDIRAEPADPVTEFGSLAKPRSAPRRLPAEKDHRPGPRPAPPTRPVARPGGWPPGLAGSSVGSRGALGSVRADEVEDLTAGRGPGGERAAAAELDVVGMGADSQRPLRNGERRVDDLASARKATRSAGRSMSWESDGARTTRRPTPSRRASAP